MGHALLTGSEDIVNNTADALGMASDETSASAALRDLSSTQKLQRAAEVLQAVTSEELGVTERDAHVARALLDGLDAACAGVGRIVDGDTCLHLALQRRNEVLQEAAQVDLEYSAWFARVLQGQGTVIGADGDDNQDDPLFAKLGALRLLVEPLETAPGQITGFLFASDFAGVDVETPTVRLFVDTIANWCSPPEDAGVQAKAADLDLDWGDDLIVTDVPEDELEDRGAVWNEAAQNASADGSADAEEPAVAHDDYELFSSTIEHMDQGLVVYDRSLAILAVNGRASEILKTPQGLLVSGNSMLDVIRFFAKRGDYGSGDPADIVRERVEQALSTREDYRVDRLIEGGDTIAITRRHAGNGRFIATFTDVTEWRESERILEQKSKLLSVALDYAEQGLVVAGEDLVILAFNEKLASFLDLSPQALCAGSSILSLLEEWLMGETGPRRLDGYDASQVIELAAQRLPFEFTAYCQDDVMLTCRGRGRDDGSYVLSFDDVTASEIGRREIEAKSEFLEATVEHMDQGLLAFDRNLKMLFANERAKTMLGVPHEFFDPGKDFTEIVREGAEQGAYGDGAVEAIVAATLVRLEEAQPFSFEGRCPDDATALVRCHPRPEGGFVFTFTDITSSKNQQNALTLVTDELRTKSVQLDSAFSSMSQGLAMFDADQKLVVCNPRYLELYDLPSRFGRPGTELAVIMRQNTVFDNGLTYEEAVKRRYELSRNRVRYVEEGALATGRVIEILHEPLADGGWLGLFTDITERKGQELALREASERLEQKSQQLESVFDNMVQGVVVFDADTRLVMCNQRYAELFQLPEHLTIAGAELREMCTYCVDKGYEGDPENLTEDRIALALQREPAEFKMQMANGRTIHAIHEPVDDGGSIAVYLDVTEQEEAEQQLRDYAAQLERQQNVLETIMANIDQGVSLIDADMTVQVMTARGMELLEFPPDELTPGDNLEAFFRYNAGRGEYGEGDIDEQVAERMELARKFEPHRFQRTRPDGTTIEVWGTPLKDGTGFVTTYSDVTEAKQREAEIIALSEQLKQANIQLDAAFNSMDQGLAMFDENQALVVRNKRYLEIFSLPDEFAQAGASIKDITEYSIKLGMESDPENIVERRTAVARSRERVVFQRSFTDGRTIEIIHEPLPDGGSLALYLDVTERVVANRRLREYTSRLEASNRELQDFAYVASHDLQEPLRKIEAFGDRLFRKCGERLGEDGRLYVNRMQDSASRLRTLINDMLDYSRVTTTAKPYVSVDLSKQMGQVLADLETTIEEAGGVVEYDDLPVLEADESQMRQLAMNLITNALKFRKPEVPPKICISSREIPDPNDSEASDGWCEISFADNGIGFSNKYADRIFTIFQRLHSRSSYEGTGIGLATCRKIAERHGGEIEADGAPGEGATFRIRLPLKQEKEFTDAADQVA